MMAAMSTDWAERLGRLWDELERNDGEQFVEKMRLLVAELPEGDPRRPYEMGSAFDSTGHSDRAVPLYREALALGLDGRLRREAVIQLASSLRNLGRAKESVQLLSAERARGSDGLDDAVSAFLALALADCGRERDAVSVALLALTPHLTRYQRSVGNYARELR